MAIERIHVDDTFAGLAINAPRRLLKPGREREALEMLRESVPSITPGTDQVVLTLTNQQRRYFASDLMRPAPRAPQSDDRRERTRFGLLHLAIACSLGTPFGIEDQQFGVLAQDVFPLKRHNGKKNTGLGSQQRFGFHTDQASNPDTDEIPDIVILGCYKNGERAKTLVVSLADVLAELDAETIDILRSPVFTFVRGSDPTKNPVPILTQKGSGITARLSAGTHTPYASRESSALLSLFSACKHVATDIILEPGEFLAFVNGVSPHGREAFKPARNPSERRFLQRTFINERV
ncbi:MAG TPA: TauD/TfdA family dioxygenase [Acidimicrobiia bacterium]|nr:TauD/TfdA family dioxygenase [Acidimicrobiia bacterium]